jgi:hypothetical protein
MNLAFNPLIAIGVLSSTATTDAVFVFFTAAVAARRRVAAANLERVLVPAVGVCGDQLYPEPGLCCIRGRPARGSAPSFSIAWLRRDRELATPRHDRAEAPG